LETSDILQITVRAAAMKRAGADVIVLGAGEPNFDTPDHARDATASAMRHGQTKYTPLNGTPALKEAITAKSRRERPARIAPNSDFRCP
jgi:aspartate aminotransferase